MRKKIIKVLVILTVMCLIIMGLSCKSFGDYVSNLRDQQANLQSQLEASNIQVEIIQSDISELAAQILQMNEDITSQEIEVDLLRSQSKELQESIEKNEVELEEITETHSKPMKITKSPSRDAQHVVMTPNTRTLCIRLFMHERQSGPQH